MTCAAAYPHHQHFTDDGVCAGLAATPAPLDAADQVAGALEIAANDVEALPAGVCDLTGSKHPDLVETRAVLAILRRPLAAAAAPPTRRTMPDDAAPARGLALGCVVAALAWAVVFLIAWFVLPGVW